MTTRAPLLVSPPFGHFPPLQQAWKPRTPLVEETGLPGTHKSDGLRAPTACGSRAMARRAGGDRAKVIADQTFQVVDGEFQPDGASEAIFNECAN